VRGATGAYRPLEYTEDRIGLDKGQWVKGTQAGRNAGRRQECLPHKSSLPHKPARVVSGEVSFGV